MGSLAELETQLIISQQIGFINENILVQVLESTEEISKMIQGLTKHIREKE
jgi:four helix bundle protein